ARMHCCTKVLHALRSTARISSSRSSGTSTQKTRERSRISTPAGLLHAPFQNPLSVHPPKRTKSSSCKLRQRKGGCLIPVPSSVIGTWKVTTTLAMHGRHAYLWVKYTPVAAGRQLVACRDDRTLREGIVHTPSDIKRRPPSEDSSAKSPATLPSR